MALPRPFAGQDAPLRSRGHLGADMIVLAGVAVIFWLTAQQAGSSLTLFAATNTASRVMMLGHSIQVGPGHFASLHGLLVLALLPAFLVLHRRTQAQAISTAGKMLWGYVATAAAFVVMATAGLHGGDLGRVSGAWLIGCYIFLSLAEVLLAPLGMSLITHLAPKGEAAQAVGLRFHAARGAMSIGESKGGLPPDRLVEDEVFILKDTQRVLETYHDAARYAMLRVVVAPCSPFTVSQDLMRESAALAHFLAAISHGPSEVEAFRIRVPDVERSAGFQGGKGVSEGRIEEGSEFLIIE